MNHVPGSMATEESSTVGDNKLDSPASTGGGRKKKKAKAKTVNLTEFLADGSSDTTFPPPKRTTSWADASEDIESDEAGVSWQEPSRVDRRALPTAPRASTQPRVEMSRLPSKPPYTAYMGNLSFEVEEDDVMDFFRRRNMKVTSVRLPRDASNRLKGFGYAEFEDLQSFLDALTLNDEQLRGRPVRLDVAEGDDKPDRRGSRSSEYDRGDWRRSHDQGMEYRRDRDSDYRRDRILDGGRRDRESEFRREHDADFKWERNSELRSDSELRRDQHHNTDVGDHDSDYRRGGDRDSEYSRGGDRDSEYRRGEDRDSEYSRVGDRDSEYRRGGDRDLEYRRGGDRDSEYRRGGDRDSEYRRVGDRDSEYRRGGDRDLEYRRGGDRDSEYRRGGDRDSEFRRAEDRDSEYRRGGDRDSGYRRARDRDSEYRRGGDRDSEYRRGGDRDSDYRRGGDRDSEYRRGGDRDSEYRRSGERDSEYRRGDSDIGYRKDRDTDYSRTDREFRRRDRDLEYGGTNRDMDYRRDRDSGYRRGRGGRDGNYRRAEDFGSRYDNSGTSQELVKERPRLQLQPRTRPLNSDSDDSSRPSIFGQAKPVDTSAREKEIEERLLRQQQQQPDQQPRPSSRGEGHPPRGDKELHGREFHHKDKESHQEKQFYRENREKEPQKDKESQSKKTNKAPPVGNAWLKGRPRILERQDDTPVFSQPSKFAALLAEDEDNNSSQDE